MAYSYDLDALQQFLDDLDARIPTIADHCDDARRIAGALSDTYRGSAASAYVEASAQWHCTAETHLESLRALRRHVANCRQNYSDADQANRSMLA
jgi:WXG100 family type VII secretion target